MADKELWKMNRTELIEITYVLQQNERMLREENTHLRKWLDDKLLCLDQAGSIAEAALLVNHIFEDAQQAAKQYPDSVQYANAQTSQMLAEAEDQLHRTEQECLALREKTDQDVKRQKESFVREVQQILQKYPELAAKLRKNER